ncbi:MAG: hybrid sensor histidine kinase/response regulator [Deltaproteobacteria bacterium]|nr:hybrid sensor histidine kinase/response regulator [Deltaproteobacteria bacterium]
MIEDKELRDLFKAESGEHLQTLEAGLLRLEKEPRNKTLMDEVFREAHSIKGSARMVGVRDVELIAHRIEDLLGRIRKGEAQISGAIVDRICRGLDSVRKLVHEAATGEPSGVDVTAVITLLKDEDDPGDKAGGRTAEQTGPEAISKTQYGAEEYRIDTVRVETGKLDSLMTLCGELTVMKTHIEHLASELGEAEEVLEEAARGGPLSGPGQKTITGRMGVKLSKLKSSAYENGAKFELILGELEDSVRSMRLLPFSSLFNLFPRAARDMARERGKDVRLVLEGGDTKADKRIMEGMKDPITHMIRNAIDHGIETPEERKKAGKPPAGTILLKAYRTDTDIIIEVKDDGRGLDTEEIKKTAIKRKLYGSGEIEAMNASRLQSVIFTSGFSTSSFVTDVSGRGVGLDVVRNNVELLKGTVNAESAPGAGLTMRVILPVTLATLRALLISTSGMTFAVPMESVVTSRMVSPKDIFSVEGRETVLAEGESISIARLADILGLKGGVKRPAGKEGPCPCIILSNGDERLGIIVDELLSEEEIILKPQSAILKRVRNISGSTILGSGEVCMLLNPKDMIKSAQKRPFEARPEPCALKEEKNLTILLVEDSITTRTQEKRILEAAGYEVTTAVNGVDALNKLAGRHFDGVVTDILMPEMDGLSLTSMIRADKRYRGLPVILVTTLSTEEDKKRGLAAGANAYIPKPSFDQKIFIETLRRVF